MGSEARTPRTTGQRAGTAHNTGQPHHDPAGRAHNDGGARGQKPGHAEHDGMHRATPGHLEHSGQPRTPAVALVGNERGYDVAQRTPSSHPMDDIKTTHYIAGAPEEAGEVKE